jgi:hypothetical protein
MHKMLQRRGKGGFERDIQCLKKLVKCFELFDCSGNISRTREDKNM